LGTDPLALDGHWLASLRNRATQEPLAQRLPLLWQGQVIGSVEPAFLEQMAHQPARNGRCLLQKGERAELVTDLADLADTMRAAALAGAWRDEALAVHALQAPYFDALAQRVGSIERGCVRQLGIVTQAVHLVGCTPDGRMWVQQRSRSKANDPGQWDTLVGGMVSAADTLDTALARETWEEAGLELAELTALAYGGRVSVRKPSEDGQCTGYMIEHIDWFRCTVPKGLEPQNQDGEVDRFECLSPAGLRERLHAGAFTLEASMVLAAAL